MTGCPEPPLSRLFCLSCLLLISRAAGAEAYDPYDADRKMIRNGVQAVLMSNGLFEPGVGASALRALPPVAESP